MKRALLASLALHAGLAGAVLLHRATPPAEPSVTEGVALVMLEVEEPGSESEAAAPPGETGPAEAMPPNMPPAAEAEASELPPPEQPPLAAMAEAPPDVVAPRPLAMPPPPPAPDQAELPTPSPEANPLAQMAEVPPPPTTPPPDPPPLAEAPAPPPEPPPPRAERPRPPQPALRPQQAARPPAPPRETAPREASIREAALRFNLPGAEGTDPRVALGGAARVEGATTTPAAPDQRNPTPPYPASSRLAGREGSVALRIEIGADGTVTHVVLTHSAGDPALDDAALTTIRRWRFRPATRDGQQVAAVVTTNVHFRLDGRR